MAVDITDVAHIATCEITVATDREIDPCHVISLRDNLLKTAGRRPIFLIEKHLYITPQVHNELFSLVTFQLCGNLFLITHQQCTLSALPAPISSQGIFSS